MSSSYHLLCLSHDPAIVIDCGDFRLADIEAVTRSHEVLANHRGCDIIAGRFSYPLVEAGCFGKLNDAVSTGCNGIHNGVIWTDKDWLRLLHAAASSGAILGALLEPFRCWPQQRLTLLRRELGIEEHAAA